MPPKKEKRKGDDMSPTVVLPPINPNVQLAQQRYEKWVLRIQELQRAKCDAQRLKSQTTLTLRECESRLGSLRAEADACAFAPLRPPQPSSTPSQSKRKSISRREDMPTIIWKPPEPTEHRRLTRIAELLMGVYWTPLGAVQPPPADVRSKVKKSAKHRSEEVGKELAGATVDVPAAEVVPAPVQAPFSEPPPAPVAAAPAPATQDPPKSPRSGKAVKAPPPPPEEEPTLVQRLAHLSRGKALPDEEALERPKGSAQNQWDSIILLRRERLLLEVNAGGSRSAIIALRERIRALTDMERVTQYSLTASQRELEGLTGTAVGASIAAPSTPRPLDAAPLR